MGFATFLTKNHLHLLQADFHGCPYKTWGSEQLAAQLTKMRIGSQQVTETVAKARAGHYQIACSMAFEGVHKCSCETGINHPNQVAISLCQ